MWSCFFLILESVIEEANKRLFKWFFLNVRQKEKETLQS